MNKTEMAKLKIAIRQMEASLRNLRAALGDPPDGHADDHPVSALEVALMHADAAVDDPGRYFLKRTGGAK